MSLNLLEAKSLSRIEELLDALETRGKNSTEFFALCSKLQKHLEMASSENTALEQAVDKDTDFKARLINIANRIEGLEIYSTTQTEITSNLQKYIVDADK